MTDDSCDPSPETPADAARVEDEVAPETALVEVAPGAALVFGSIPTGLDVLPVSLLKPAELERMSIALNTATGILNVGAQGLPALMNAKGLVRLAPETLKAMQAGAVPVKDGAYNLGVLAGQNGKFATQVRWMPAAGANAAGVVAALGPALAMLAIQAQLNQLTGLVQKNIELTSSVLKAHRIEQWSELAALDEAVSGALREARDVGSVTNLIWGNLGGKEAELRKTRKYFVNMVSDHTRTLATKERHTDRRDHLRQHAAAILADVHGMLTAQNAWYSYQALRAGHAHRTAAVEPDDAKLLAMIARDAPVEHHKALDAAADLVDELLMEVNILAALDGKKTLPFGKQKKAASEVAAMAGALRDAVDGLRHGLPRPVKEELAIPDVAAFAPDDEVPDRLLEVLRWHLTADEELLALGAASQQGWLWSGSVFAAVTDRRLLVANAGDILDKGVVEQSIPLEDVRYVRYSAGTTKESPRVEVFTPSADVRLEFGSWARSDKDRTPVEQIAQLLADASHTPEAEKAIVSASKAQAALEPGSAESPALDQEGLEHVDERDAGDSG